MNVQNTLFVLPAKHGGHIGIMTLLASSSASSGCHTFGFLSITFEEIHQFHSKLIKE